MKEIQKPMQAKNDETQVVSPRNANLKKESKSQHWKSVMIGGIPGIALGAASVLAATSISANAAEADDDHTGGIHIPADVPVATDVNDDMSFAEAFAAARDEVGPGGVFTWHGQLYNTYTQEEWAAKYPETPLENTDPTQPVSPESKDQEEPQQESPQEPNQEQSSILTDEDGNPIKVEVDGIASISTDDGEVVNVVAAQVDGHDAVFIDHDNDGYIDTVAVDSDDDGQISLEEVTDATDSEIHILDMVAPEDAGIDVPEDDLYSNTDDYTNDADVSDLA